MPELKHNFLKGRMNKDLDERLVPNGEYRDALNIEVSTSEGSNAGTVQTVMGNKKLSDLPFISTTKCVGKILDEKNDKLYWFVSEVGNRPSLNRIPPTYGDYSVSDLIMEIDVSTGDTRPVIVDTFYSTMDLTGHDPNQGDGRWISLDSTSWSGNMQYVVYPGMEVDCIDGNGNQAFPEGTVVVDVSLSQFQVKVSNPPINPADMNINFASYRIKFENFNRALNFQNELVNGSTVITGINIIDNFLFWTDNNSEPKKINIDTSKRERETNLYVGNQTGLNFRNDFQTQSVLVVSDITSTIPKAITVARGNAPWTNTALVPLEEKHVTVIRKSPSQALNLTMRTTTRSYRTTGTLDYSNPQDAVVDNSAFPFQTITTTVSAPGAFNPFWDYSSGQVKESAWVSFGGPDSPINQIPLTTQGGNPWWASSVPIWETGDVVVFTTLTFPEEFVRAKVGRRDKQHGSYELFILSSSDTLGDNDRIYDAVLEQPSPLFEFKFPRFSYRYKYEDGEYSTFAPFSEVAFLPGKFEYLPKKGYNLGMTNNVRKLVLKDFIDSKLLPKDVISIDILYKESNSPNIYTAKTITKDDFEWNAISESELATSGVRGYVNITSELIHAILPSNQLLRPWDNVPRKALGQEIVGNRLVYGNYLQNYDMRDNNGANININLELSSSSRAVGSDSTGSFNYTPEQNDAKNAYRYSPSKSIKTLRTYQLGVVYRDKYGRETPVFSTDIKRDGGDTSKASLLLEKKLADQQNKLKATINSPAPSWAETYKFFIKETSNEYYNLAMDRWYDAADDNIWLSFPSSERNKVDLDTFLILKKEKDNNDFVPEPARYKILAIENEAPLHVKTVEHNLGKCSDTFDPGSGVDKTTFRTGPNSSTGFPVENAAYMYVRAESFGQDTGSWGMGWHKSIIEQGRPNLYMRMRTPALTSNWYKIKSISLEQTVAQGGSGDMYRIDIEKGTFGADMNITCTTPSSISTATIAAGLALEIKQNVIENKPEFQGRFFAKIYKDDIIVEKLIKPMLENVEYIVQDARQLEYIHNSNESDGDETGPYQSLGITNWANATGWSTSDPNNVGATAESMSRETSTSLSGGQNFWQGQGAGWFIDKAKGYRYREHESGGGCGKIMIKYRGSDPNKEEHVWDGKGIYNNGRSMHLSFSKPGVGTNLWTCNTWNNASSTTQNRTRNMLINPQLVTEVAFLNKLTSAGTLFRWREDPDQHIYVTEVTWQHQNPSGSGGLDYGMHVWNFFQWQGSPVNPRIFDYMQESAGRNRFNIRFRRLSDGAGMGDPGGKHNAQYTPVNDPGNVGWFDSNGVNLAEKGTCTDSTYDNDQQGCLDVSGTWTWASDAFYADATYANANNVAEGTWKTTAPDRSIPYAAPGIRQDGHGGIGTKTNATPNPGTGNASSQPGAVTLEILEPLVRPGDIESSSVNPAVWETEPKEDIGMDIYHEVGQIYPVEINDKTNELFAPVGSVVECWRSTNTSWYSNNPCWDTVNGGSGQICDPNNANIQATPSGQIILGISSSWDDPIRVKSWDDNVVTLEDSSGNLFTNNSNFPNEHIMPEDHLSFRRPDGSRTTALVGDATSINGAEYTLNRDVHGRSTTLPWFNCYSFGNGVESDRIRDDFNQVTIDNGPKASTTLDEPYLEERRGSGFIWSGIYNSTSGINNLNQFIQAEKITKDLNPSYGSIQKLHTRDTDLITLCEDKVLKVLANKDALFNADGNANLTATENVLGQTTPFVGEFGISKNPESFASESFRAYFTDKQRGVVLRLSRDGLTPISETGMKDWFADNLRPSKELIGTYDDKKSTYNLTLVSDNSKTISFSEKSKGWTSFKSFIPEVGESLNNIYYTFKQGDIWKHHDDTVSRNSFYSETGTKNYDSTINVLFNDIPGSVKSIRTLNYEGSQAKITQNLQDLEYYNNEAKLGWYVDNIKTDLQETGELEFKDKEGKWFSNIKGESTNLSNLDTREFSVQGIGNASAINAPNAGCTDPTANNYNPNAVVDDGSCTYSLASFNCTSNGCVDPGDGTGTYTSWCDCMEQGNGSLLANITGGCCGATGNPFGQYESLCLNNPSPPTVYGCTDSTTPALNYYTAAQIDNCSCAYPPTCLLCTDPSADNSVPGCCDSNGQINYNPNATCDDGSCIPIIYGCMDDGTDPNYPGRPANYTDPNANPPYPAANYYAAANTTSSTIPCVYYIYGCTDSTATNHDPNANVDDGSCTYAPVSTSGCMDSTATNYNSSATVDDGSCIWPVATCDANFVKPVIDVQLPITGYPGSGWIKATVPAPRNLTAGQIMTVDLIDPTGNIVPFGASNNQFSYLQNTTQGIIIWSVSSHNLVSGMYVVITTVNDPYLGGSGQGPNVSTCYSPVNFT